MQRILAQYKADGHAWWNPNATLNTKMINHQNSIISDIIYYYHEFMNASCWVLSTVNRYRTAQHLSLVYIASGREYIIKAAFHYTAYRTFRDLPNVIFKRNVEKYCNFQTENGMHNISLIWHQTPNNFNRNLSQSKIVKIESFSLLD